MLEPKGDKSDYEVRHTPQEGPAFYKLKMVDIDQRAVYSQLVQLNFNCEKATVQIFPNPASDAIHISTQGLKGLVMFALISSEGRIVRTAINHQHEMIMDTKSLAEGAYNLVMNNADGRKEVHRIIIKH